MNTLNLRKKVRKYLTITFNDEKETTLQVLSPTKAIMDELVSIEKSTIEGEISNDQQIDSLFNITAKILSRNLSGKTITKPELAKICDIEDIQDILNAYMEFIGEQISGKN